MHDKNLHILEWYLSTNTEHKFKNKSTNINDVSKSSINVKYNKPMPLDIDIEASAIQDNARLDSPMLKISVRKTEQEPIVVFNGTPQELVTTLAPNILV